MRSVLSFALVASACGELWQRTGDDPVQDPANKHCFDVSADLTNPLAVEWQSANAYLYKTWKKGLCDGSKWPSLEHTEYPPSTEKHVAIRKFGKGASLVAPLSEAAGKDCRTDKTSVPISINFVNGASNASKIRGCQDQYACKPYADCELALPNGASETIIIDASFKYFVFTQHDGHGETELYPDANLKYPTKYTIEDPTGTPVPEMMERMGEMLSTTADYIISLPSPGHQSHCTEIDFKDGKNNPYFQAHGYQYTSPPWNIGRCSKKYNWFNKNVTIAPGVEETLLGTH